MKFVTRPVKIDAEEITHVDPEDGAHTHTYNVLTTEKRFMTVVTSQKVEVGDYLNVTDPEDIYHVPRRFFHGCDRKYDRVVK